MNLIYDRTAEDVERALALAKKAEAGTLTDTEKTEWLAGLRGCYNAADLNRVEAAVTEIAAELNAAGYPVEITPVLKGSSRVPAGYTEVEWIQSSGTQYIDTGIPAKDITDSFIDFRFVSVGTAELEVMASFVDVDNRLQCGWAGSAFKTGMGATYSQTADPTARTTATCVPVGSPASTVYLFAQNQSNAPKWQCNAEIYSCNISTAVGKVRDFIPCKNPSGAVGLYDLIGGEFYTTPTAVTLPAGYTQIAYLQSTGTQYIDSGVKGDSDVRVTTDFEITAFGSGTTFIFGAQGTDSVRYTLGMTSAGAFRSDFGTAMTSGSEASLNTRYSADKNGNVCTVGGQTLTSAAATFTGTTNIYLFGRSYSSVSCSQIKMYRCKMYKGGTLIRDFVPCKNPDGVAGLYDIVSGAFYTNQGSGTFTAGADIVGFTAGAEVGKAEDREWRESDIVRLSQWRQYLANVQALRDAYYTLGETGQLPDAADKLGYVGANNIEKVLADIDLLLDGMKSIYRRAGTFSVGGNYVRQMIRSV